MRPTSGLGAGAALLGLAYVLVSRGDLTLDTGLGRRVRPLGPLSWTIGAPREVVFDVVAEPYLERTPRALAEKLQVWERTGDMALAAHFTPAGPFRARTVETVRFERPETIHFRLLRGPVPHVTEQFRLAEVEDGTELTWVGELGTDLWALGALWGDVVERVWERTVVASVESVRSEAERRAGQSNEG